MKNKINQIDSGLVTYVTDPPYYHREDGLFLCIVVCRPGRLKYYRFRGKEAVERNLRRVYAMQMSIVVNSSS